MTTKTLLPLDSVRLAQYAVQVPCYICEQGNTFDAEICRHCLAPMALAHQTATRKAPPQMLGVIGPSGVGKTVYLGMLLDMLSREPSRMPIVARGAFSINLQQMTIGSLEHCEFPTKTANEPDRWNWVHCQLRLPKRSQPLELIVPDMAGEAVLEEVDHPNTYLSIRSFLSKCAGVVALIDAPRLAEGDRQNDYFTMKLLGYLSELDDDPKTGWRTRPVALVLSKADQCDKCFDDPAGFVRDHSSALWQLAHERFCNSQFFAASVAGGTTSRLTTRGGRQQIPLRIEPRGVVEPFEWIVNRLKT